MDVPCGLDRNGKTLDDALVHHPQKQRNSPCTHSSSFDRICRSVYTRRRGLGRGRTQINQPSTRKKRLHCINALFSFTFAFQWAPPSRFKDDGSTDDSGGICDRYKEKDDRIHVIHKTNKGLSSARNAGLSAIQGEYVGFVDGDDFIDEHMYATLIKAALTNKADVVQTGYRHTDENGDILDAITFRQAVYNNLDDMFHAFFDEGNIHVGVWTKLYKRTIFTNITFFEGYVFEDYTILPDILKACRRFVIIDGAFYNYAHNPQSITRSNTNLIVLKSRVAAPIHLLNNMADMDRQYLGYAYRYICFSSIKGYAKIKEADEIDNKTLAEYESKLINQYRKYFHLFRKEAPFRKEHRVTRMSLYIFYLNPYLGHLVRHSFGKAIRLSKRIIVRMVKHFSKRTKPGSSI